MKAKPQILTEVAVFTPWSAIEAIRNGADRIELCSGYSEGGLSPTAATISYVRRHASIPVHVMVRPRVGDFIYGDVEKAVILEDIDYCRQVGIDGVVLGCLTRQGGVDKEFLHEAVDRAGTMSLTFHRAFDLCTDLQASLEELVECGVGRVLTSGGQPNAIKGADSIRRLVELAGDKIIILPGGGLEPGNVSDFIGHTRVKEIHFSGKRLIKSPGMVNENVNLTSHGQVDDNQWYECDGDLVKEMVGVVNC